MPCSHSDSPCGQPGMQSEGAVIGEKQGRKQVRMRGLARALVFAETAVDIWAVEAIVPGEDRCTGNGWQLEVTQVGRRISLPFRTCNGLDLSILILYR